MTDTQKIYKQLQDLSTDNTVTVKIDELIILTGLSKYKTMIALEKLKQENRIRLDCRSKYILLDK